MSGSELEREMLKMARQVKGAAIVWRIMGWFFIAAVVITYLVEVIK